MLIQGRNDGAAMCRLKNRYSANSNRLLAKLEVRTSFSNLFYVPTKFFNILVGFLFAPIQKNLANYNLIYFLEKKVEKIN